MVASTLPRAGLPGLSLMLVFSRKRESDAVPRYAASRRIVGGAFAESAPPPTAPAACV
jgi:hypothetical protein